MHSIAWRYRVGPGCRAAFEALYGADGDWARLFRRDPAYLGTTLYRDTDAPDCYLSLDRWTTRAAYAVFLEREHAGYAALDARGDALTLEQARLAAFDR